MSLLKHLVATGGVSTPPTYVDDVFSAVPFDSTGSGTVQVVNTGFNFNHNYDPSFGYVKLLASFNTDNVNKANNTLINLTTTSVTSGKFGYFLRSTRSSGTGTTEQSYQPVSISSSDWSSPWCLEGWLYAGTDDVDTMNTAMSILLNTNGLSGNSFVYVQCQADADGNGNCTVRMQVTDNLSAVFVSTTSLPQYTFNFVRLNWDGSFLRAYVNGVLQNSVAFGGFSVFPDACNPKLRVYVTNGIAASGTAGIDEVRWTFGDARTSTNTVVPTAPFPATATQGGGGLTIVHSRNGTFDTMLLENYSSVATNTAWNQSSPQTTQSSFGIAGLTTNGFIIGGSNVGFNSNASYQNMCWSFKRNPKFFDIIEYTGNNSAQTLSHSLDCAVGLIKVKRMDNTGEQQYSWHNALTSGQHLIANSNAAVASGGDFFPNVPTSTTFSVGAGLSLNGVKYVAMLWANDVSTNSNIKCGSFTAAASDVFVDLGFEPQAIIVKNVNTNSDWLIFDTFRGLSASGTENAIALNTTSAELSWNNYIKIANNGFYVTNNFGVGTTVAYVAIRRSNKPPTSGTQVFNAVARTGTEATATITGAGFPPDLVIPQIRNASVWGANWFDRLRGANNYLQSAATIAENGNGVTTDTLMSFDSDGVSIGADTAGYMNTNTRTFVNWLFRRASGVFDTVCYTGTGTTNTIVHNLTTVPELVIFKSRSSATNWYVATEFGSSTLRQGFLNATNLVSLSADYSGASHFSSQPTSTGLPVGSHLDCNGSGKKYIAYLFATKTGISKVGSYTGNGSSQNIDCGFAGGARFILIKRTDAAGDWLVADSARGIVAGNDPYLKLNSTASEVATEDWIDPLASGFIVNQVASSNANVNGANYIYLAFS